MSLDKYQFHQCIGKGNFGDVYKATNLSSNSLVAIKVINLDETNEDIKVLIQEIQFLSRLKSPYITRYFETFINEMSMFIVMEYCGGGSCADLLKFYKKLPEDLVAYIIRDVLRGLNYLHQEKKVHRDIKSANILLTNYGEIKLADFGVSGEITMTQLKRNTFVGTPFWMAPEVITRRRNGGYNEKADIWSTGITTIELVTGSPPLAQFDPMKILFEIPKNKPPLLTGLDFSENIKDFVRYCLLKDPKKRPSSSKLLHHRFITTIKPNIDLSKIIEQKNQWFELNNKASKKPRYQIFSKPEVNSSIKWDFDTFKTFHSSKMQQTLVNLYNDVSPYLNRETNILNDLSSPKTFDSPNTNNSNIALKSQINSPISSPIQQLQMSENYTGSPVKKKLVHESPNKNISTDYSSPDEYNKKLLNLCNPNSQDIVLPTKYNVSPRVDFNGSPNRYNSPQCEIPPDHAASSNNEIASTPNNNIKGQKIPQSPPLHNSNSPYHYQETISKGEILFYCLEQVYIRGRNDSTKKTVHNLINNLLEYEMEQPGLSEAIVEEIFQFKATT